MSAQKKILFVIAFLFFAGLVFYAGIGSADSQISKLGTGFSSATGSYATSTHCVSGQTCGWLSTNEILIGAYNYDPVTWGGSATWSFDLSGIDLNSIDRASLQVSWPATVGEGLHSPVATGEGFVKINNNEVSRLVTNYTRFTSGNNDYYAHNLGIFYLNFPFNSSYLSASTDATLGTGSKTIWAVTGVKLYLYESNKTVRIVNGKFLINKTEFMSKGIDYVPWIKGTGPAKGQHQPFPNENEDVTSKMNNSGVITVTDYNSNGKIEAWEVIQYDMGVMKSAGINTIRIYSSGGWHDRNLNGVVDANENVQGDMPDWLIDRVLNYAGANNMKVIIGYWVTEENYAENPPLANFDDLLVAKQAFGRVVNKYKNNSAVLAWGIGNEVQLKLNMDTDGFNWSVDINSYLNQLNDYVRTLDKNHPIIYAKYVREDANFNNNNADIISINAHVSSAQGLIDAGEFNISAPQGKAYMLGEYGFNLGDAEGQWNLAKQYSGGSFLEYSDIWWKVDTSFGIVTQYREKKPARFNKLLYLYTGTTVVCSLNSDCGSDGFTGSAVCNASNNKQVLRDYTTYTCSNPGTALSSCSSSISPRVSSSCAGNDICDSGVCSSVACSANGDCGTSGYVGGDYCSGKDVMRNYTTFTCNDAGTVLSSCSNVTAAELKSNCIDVCESGVCQNILCGADSDCGVSGVVGSAFCNVSGRQTVQNYTSYSCVNPGLSSSYCSNANSTVLSETCALDEICSAGACTKVVCSSNVDCGTDNWNGNNVCSLTDNKQILKNFTTYTCNAAGTALSSCSANTELRANSTCTGNEICDAGACSSVSCSANADCGIDEYVGSNYCSGKEVMRNYTAYTCSNPGTALSSCSSSTSAWANVTCADSCLDGACVISESNETSNMPFNPNRTFYESFDNLNSVIVNGGTFNGAANFVNNGFYGNAINLTSGQVFINYSSAVAWPATYPNVTIQFLVKPSNKTKMGLFDLGGLSGMNPNAIGIFRNVGYAWAEVRNNVTAMTQMSWVDLLTDKWNLITLTVEPAYSNCAYFRFYVNDVASSATVCGFYPNLTREMLVGRTQYYGQSYAYFDELQVFNYTKSGAEVKNDYLTMFTDTGQQPLAIRCNINNDCGITGFSGPVDSCNNRHTTANYTSFYCSYGGTSASLCTNYTYKANKEACNYSCSLGQCTLGPEFSNFYLSFDNMSSLTDRAGIISGNVNLTNTNCGSAADLTKGGYISYPTIGNFPSSGPFSIEFWMKSSNKTYAGIFGAGLPYSPGYLYIFENLYSSYDQIDIQLYNSSSRSAYIYGRMNKNDWNHIVFSFADTSRPGCNNMTLYINSKVAAVGMICGYKVNLSREMFIGYANNGPSSYAYLDEFRILNYDLNQSEISADYARMRGCFGGCSANSECGTDGFIGSTSCNATNNKQILQNYQTFTCNNSGAALSSCSNSTDLKLTSTCTGNDICDAGVCTSVACSANSDCGVDRFTGSNYCSGKDIFRDYMTFSCSNPGTALSSCSNSTAPLLNSTCSGTDVCDAGACSSVSCSANADCGTDAYSGGNYCSGKDILRNYTTFTCNNAGTVLSSCSNVIAPRANSTCNATQICDAGACIANTTGTNQTNTSVPPVMPSSCRVSSDCGASGFIGGGEYCGGSDVWGLYKTYTCVSRFSASGYCTSSVRPKLKQACSYSCSNGTCTSGSNEFSTFYQSFENMSEITSRGGALTGGSMRFASTSCGNAADLTRRNYLSYPLAGNFPRSGEFSVEFWVKPTTSRASGMFGIDKLRNTKNSMAIYSIFDRPYFEISNNATGRITISASSSLSRDAWNHIAVTMSSSQQAGCYDATIYINSVKQPTTRSICNLSPSTAKDMWVGTSGFYGASRSYMDEFRIVNYAMNQSEISADYARMQTCTA